MTGRTDVTISPPEREPLAARETAPPRLLTVENGVTLTFDPETRDAEALERADALASLALPRLLEGTPDINGACADVQAALTGPADVTARHGVDGSLVATVDCVLPVPEEKAGLHPVRRAGTATRLASPVPARARTSIR
ncbi:hypothetical protein [Streptomyces sp. NPDC046976]|uniref:hypothetical protein n=1 Tax=Streptomyces sp. NPDC046976 TaxID=3155258 RepID=UPI0033C6DE12